MEEIKYNYQNYWDQRARYSFWVTRNVSYRIGSLLAMMAYRFGVRPSLLSYLTVVVALVSVVAAIHWSSSLVVSSCVLFLGLQIGYALDCADGPLARVTGQVSSSGALTDKSCDLVSAILILGGLAYATPPLQFQQIDISILALIVCLTPRLLLMVMLWMKERSVTPEERYAFDCQHNTLGWKVKRAAGFFVDEPVYRIALAVSWSLHLFWPFVLVYGFALSVVAVVYFLAARRELDQYDRLKLENPSKETLSSQHIL